MIQSVEVLIDDETSLSTEESHEDNPLLKKYSKKKKK
jgi:hypothetical protein